MVVVKEMGAARVMVTTCKNERAGGGDGEGWPAAARANETRKPKKTLPSVRTKQAERGDDAVEYEYQVLVSYYSSVFSSGLHPSRLRRQACNTIF